MTTRPQAFGNKLKLHIGGRINIHCGWYISLQMETAMQKPHAVAAPNPCPPAHTRHIHTGNTKDGNALLGHLNGHLPQVSTHIFPRGTHVRALDSLSHFNKTTTLGCAE